VLEHRLHPLPRDHLRVVVEQEYVLSLGVGDAEVVDPRIVEGFSKRDDPMGYGIQVLDGLRIAAVVVHYQQFVVAVGRQPLDAFYAIPEQGDVVSSRNYYTHLRLTLDLYPGTEAAG
jgi:hypothetical protein